jgi:hypothetical protein
LSTFNPADKNAAITLSSGNLIATANATTQAGVRGTLSYPASGTGRFYFEMTSRSVISSAFGVGIANATWSFTNVNGIGGDVNSVGYAPTTGQVFVNNAVVGTASTATASGVVIGCAIDFPGKKIYIRVGAGNWNASATNNPATNTGGFPLTALASGAFFPAFGTVGTTTDAVQFNGGTSTFAQPAPATFQPWDGLPPARGLSVSRGRTAGTFILSISTIDPWAGDFSSDFGPLSTASSFAGSGKAQSTGRGSPAVARPVVAKGSALAVGRTILTSTAALAARGLSRASNLSAITSTRLIIGQGIARASGKNTATNTFGLVARGIAISNGRAPLARAASFIGIGKARSSGVAAIATPAVLLGKGRGDSRGRGLAIYTTPPPQGVIWSRGSSSGRAALSTGTALSAVGASISKGAAVQGSSFLILTASSAARTFGQSAATTQAAALNAASRATLTGRGGIGGARPIVAAGAARARGGANALMSAFVPSRGKGTASGRLAPGVSVTPLSAIGLGESAGKSAAAFATRLQVVSRGQSAGRAAPSVAKPLLALGQAQVTGQIGANGAQRLSTTVGNAKASARALLQPVAALAGYGLARTVGRIVPTATQALSAAGAATSMGVAAKNAVGSQRARGMSVSTGAADTLGLASAALSGSGKGTSSGSAVPAERTALSSLGRAQGQGRLAQYTGAVALSANGRATATARVGSFGFAPIALSASGQAFGRGIIRASAGTTLHGTGIGLSAGRCAAIASTLMLANGRGGSAGHLSAVASAAVGFQSRGLAEASGRLFARNTISAKGRSAGSGTALMAGFYNVTPDAAGPRLSTIKQLPYFDSMDVGDVDFFSFDWSSRVSLLRDPIISATVTASPSGLSVGPVVIVGDIVQTRVGNSALMETFSLRCTVTLRSGRILHWSAPVSVEDF